jgi:hypothetical protein
MTSIEVTTTEYQSENRSWSVGKHGWDLTPSITLDVSKFTAGTHYPKGFVPSGIVLAKIDATGLYGPYDPAATDGRATAAGHLFSSLNVAGKTRVGGALFIHGGVFESRLPSGHGLDADGKAALSQISYL